MESDIDDDQAESSFSGQIVACETGGGDIADKVGEADCQNESIQ